MKKGLIAVIIIALVGLGVFTYINFNNTDQVHDNMNDDMATDEMKDDDMVSEDMQDDDMKDDMKKDDDMASDEMKDDEMTEVEVKNSGEAAEAFELVSVNGETIKLTDLQGEKVYLKFWASWCHICLEGLPHLNDLAGQDTDYRIITIVSPGHNGERETEDFKTWWARQDADNLTVLLDETGEITNAYGVRGYPTSVFVGSDGINVRTLPGHLNNDVITQFFDDIY